LVDANLPRRLAVSLTEAWHDAVHVADLGMSRTTDVEILEVADRDERVLPTDHLTAPYPRRYDGRRCAKAVVGETEAAVLITAGRPPPAGSRSATSRVCNALVMGLVHSHDAS
jgi:Domain of unknown function (DUF5615)